MNAKKTLGFEVVDEGPVAAHSRHESRVNYDGLPRGKRESALHESPPRRRESKNPATGRREPADGPQVQRYSRVQVGQPSTQLQWQPRPRLGGSHRSGIYSNDSQQHRGGARENTYRLQPKQEELFSAGKVQRLVEEFLGNYLGGEQYDQQKCSQMAIQMADIIKERVKKMDFPRHKLTCHVIIGENRGQGIQVSSRCLWDEKNDGSATATFSNNSIVAVATVYALYFE